MVESDLAPLPLPLTVGALLSPPPTEGLLDRRKNRLPTGKGMTGAAARKARPKRATHRKKTLEKALAILMDAQQLFPKKATILYNLACCDAQLGNLELARGWLRDAIRLVPGCQKMAEADSDLELLREVPHRTFGL